MLEDIFPLALLDDAVDLGLVRKQVHPELPLAILNYTEKAAYDRVWNEATLACRGLIYDTVTGEVVARPFPKFFNYGEHAEPVRYDLATHRKVYPESDFHHELDLDAWAIVTEKMDGSLGILYPTPTGHAVATRGSFTSEQALHATAVWRERYADVFRPADGVTYLFEIVYPENRIVCDYGDTDDLFLLAMIDVATGEDVYHDDGDPGGWPGPVVETHSYRTLAAALAAEPRPGKEGLVVSITTGGPPIRLKIKQADYVALHRIVTGLNRRTVWEHIGAGLPLEELIAPLPDEFRPWVEDVAQTLAALVASQAREIEQEFERIIAVLEQKMLSETPYEDWTRRDFAKLAKQSKWSWALFLRLDGRDYGSKLWRMAKPEAVGPAGRVYSEDVA